MMNVSLTLLDLAGKVACKLLEKYTLNEKESVLCLSADTQCSENY